MTSVPLLLMGLSLSASLLLFPICADAVDGDTRIHIDINAQVSRVRPRPTQGPVAIKLDVVLHADGTIDDAYLVPGAHPNEGNSKDGRFGKSWHVLDDHTIERHIAFKDRVEILLIVVNDTNCKARYTLIPMPGVTEWEDRSVQLGQPAFYRDWRMTSATCTIR